MAQANQMRGATNVSNISRQSLSDIGKTQQTYGEDIRKAIAERAGIGREAADDLIKNIMDLRAGEREYSLAQSATGQKQSYQKFALKQQKISGRQEAKSRKGQKKITKLQQAGTAQEQATSLANQMAVIGAQQAAGGGGGGGGRAVLKDPYKGVRRGLDILHSAPDTKPKKVLERRREAIGILVKNGIDPRAARVAVNRYTKKARGAKAPPGLSPKKARAATRAGAKRGTLGGR
jgi:hypothetical protein